MVNKLDSSEAYLKRCNGDNYSTACLRHHALISFSTCEDHFELQGVV